ncbi:carbonic anhydrase [Rhodobacter sp. NSM]|uniref:carbonic anhydrase n=1 Tax=Rhodobacter sp. NSM TaxID=3457501 RepID=UPI003FD53442
MRHIIAKAAVSLLLSAGLAEAEGLHWTYEGAEGPAQWGALSTEFGACASGHEQSPIDLKGAVTAATSVPALDWNADADWTVSNNGHTVQASASNGGSMVIDGKTYELLQFHLHTPSEHAIDGKRAPMEVHFVHKAADGALAVIGVMMGAGGANEALDKVVAAAPAHAGEAHLGPIDFVSLLPSDRSFFRYQGSLTTPPCSETVLWTVMQSQVAVSDEAISAFSRLFEMNARPLQETHRRFILSQ